MSDILLPNQHCFYASLTAEINVERADLIILLESCNSHYDFTVRSCVQEGGFLYGAKNRMYYMGDNYCSVRVSNRELQLLIKSLEGRDREFKESNKLSDRLWSILKEMSSTQESINNKL